MGKWHIRVVDIRDWIYKRIVRVYRYTESGARVTGFRSFETEPSGELKYTKRYVHQVKRTVYSKKKQKTIGTQLNLISIVYK